MKTSTPTHPSQCMGQAHAGCLHVSSATWRGAFAALLALCLIGLAVPARAVTVKVDSAQNWVGYMNFLTTAAAWKPGGSAWAVTDLRAGFVKTNTNPSGWPLNDYAWLRPNTNTYNVTNLFWNNPDGTPNTLLEQNFYVDVFTNYGGQTVTFSGTVLSNTLPVPPDPTHPTNGYLAYAVVKEFTAPGYGWVGLNQVALGAPGTPFTVSRAIPAGGICQYGILVIGPNAAPNSPTANAVLALAVEDSDPAFVSQPVGVSTNAGASFKLTAKAAGATAVSYQWQRSGTNLPNAGVWSNVTTTNLTFTGATTNDSGVYRCIATDTAGSATSTEVTVTIFDILITSEPADLRLQVGSTAVFTVQATSGFPLSYQWKSIIGGVTNNLVDGPNVTGSTTNTLTLSNVQVTNSGTYLVRITGGANAANADAILLVRTPADWVNFLENPGFENDPTGVNESPWVRFGEVTYPPTPDQGRFVKSTDTYYGGNPVNVYEGTYVSFTTFNGTWSGIYQDVPTTPGTTFSADMWFYNAGGSGGDPIPGPWVTATNECYLEIQFRNSLDQCIHQYITPLMNYTTQSNVWFNLAATNAGAYSVPNTPATNNTPYLVAPAGTVKVRFQVTLHDIANSTAAGSLYYDKARLMLKLPVTLTAAQSGGNTQVSWLTLGATDYDVEYKNSLSDANWTFLETVSGTGSTVTRSYASSGTGRLYRVVTK